MPLSNSQYDEIFRKYDEKQLASQHQLERRTKDVYARIPALKEIDDAIATCSVEQARRLLDGDAAALATLREKLSDYRRQKEQLLQEHGLTSDYLKPRSAAARPSAIFFCRSSIARLSGGQMNFMVIQAPTKNTAICTNNVALMFIF